MHEVHDLYNYLSFVFNNLLHACIAAIYAFIDESGYAPTNSLFRLSHFLETSRKKCFDSLTSCSIHDFMQRHHFVTVGSRIFKARHEKSSARTGGWIVTPGSSSFALLGVDRNHWIFWLWRSRRLWWWISHVDQWRWVLDVKSIWNKRSVRLRPLRASSHHWQNLCLVEQSGGKWYYDAKLLLLLLLVLQLICCWRPIKVAWLPALQASAPAFCLSLFKGQQRRVRVALLTEKGCVIDKMNCSVSMEIYQFWDGTLLILRVLLCEFWTCLQSCFATLIWRKIIYA